MERWVLNVTFLILVLEAIFELRNILAYGKTHQIVNYLLYMGLGGIMTYYQMLWTPDAIRYVDPSWNKVPSGQLLWPRMLYNLGIKDYPATE